MYLQFWEGTSATATQSERYDAQREAKAAALQARLVELWQERDARSPQERAAVTAEIAQVGREIAEFDTPGLAAPLASWG